MKELSIEEKAKAYDEALERANELYDEHERDIALLIFPELKESEDERIRKELLEHCKNQAKPYIQTGNKCPQIQSWIAWLEKQGQKKSIDDLTQQEAMDIAVAKCFNEQKPADKEMKELLQTEYEKSRADAVAEMQKPWSEEDIEMIGTLVAIFEVNYPNGFYKVNPIGTTNMQGIHSSEIIKWLKSLKDKVLPQPKQEWKPSTFHLECVEDAIAMYKERGINSIGLKDILEELNKLRKE